MVLIVETGFCCRVLVYNDSRSLNRLLESMTSRKTKGVCSAVYVLPLILIPVS